MRIVVSVDGAARLEEPDDFRRFSVEMPSRLLADASNALSDVGRLADATHVWVRPDAVRKLYHGSDELSWQSQFEAMHRFAESRDWLGPEGAIRAHIEFVDEADPNRSE